MNTVVGLTIYWILLALLLAIIALASIWLSRHFKAWLRSKDNKPVMYKGILMRDHCSRLIGEIYESRLNGGGSATIDHFQRLVTIGETFGGEIIVQSSDNCDEIHAAGMIAKAEVAVNGR